MVAEGYWIESVTLFLGGNTTGTELIAHEREDGSIWYEFILTDDAYVEIIVQPYYEVDIASGTEFNVSYDPGTVLDRFRHGEMFSFTVSVNAGYTLESVKAFFGNDTTGTTLTSVSGVYSISVTDNVSIVVDAKLYNTVTYDLNDGSGTLPTETDKFYGQTFQAASSAGLIPPSGKQFREWNTQADGSGTGYAAGGTVTMPASGLMLYAVWDNVYTVTYSLASDNGTGTGTPPTETDKKEGDEFKAADPPAGSAAPDGHVFRMWSTQADGEGAAYWPGDTVTMPGHALTLYAIWVLID
jgi:hypothetical protein